MRGRMDACVNKFTFYDLRESMDRRMNEISGAVSEHATIEPHPDGRGIHSRIHWWDGGS